MTRAERPLMMLSTALCHRAADALLGCLGRDAIPGVAVVDGVRYGRTVRIDGRCGLVFAARAGAKPMGLPRVARTHLEVEISLSLLLALMPLLARLRQLFDLDAEPTVIDAQLEKGGLGELVARRPGVRVPGAIDPFEAVLGVLVRGTGAAGAAARAAMRRVVLRRRRERPGHPARARRALAALARLRRIASRAARARRREFGVRKRRAIKRMKR